jgi:5-methylcytosine-specific restriction endonuclease McrA
MTRRPDHIPARKPFSKAIRDAVTARSGGVCEKLGCSGKAAEFDHGIPVAIGGESTLENCFHLCADCHRKKSALDVKLIARADRAGGRSGQRARRERAKAAGTYRGIASPKVSPLSKESKSYMKRKFETRRTK